MKRQEQSRRGAAEKSSSSTPPRGRKAASPETACLSRQGYDHLIGRILSGAIHPGDEINRRQIAQDLRMSLAPVNEAIAQLQSEGFVEVSPRRQTRVRIIRREEVRGLLILREAIECQAARIYCGEPVVREKKRLLELASVVDGSVGGTRENEVAEREFHVALVGLVDSPLLSQEFDRIMLRRLFHKINLVTPWDTQPPMDSHQALVRKLQTKDANEAEAAIRRHLERGREGILK